MSKAKKLRDKVLSGASDKNIAFNDLCKLLDDLGFSQRKGKGSHGHIYAKDGVEEIINLQANGSEAKPYQVKQVREIVVKYKL